LVGECNLSKDVIISSEEDQGDKDTYGNIEGGVDQIVVCAFKFHSSSATQKSKPEYMHTLVSSLCLLYIIFLHFLRLAFVGVCWIDWRP
jgi:hypothetical protein